MPTMAISNCIATTHSQDRYANYRIKMKINMELF
jgi:hypothetical protein